MEILKPQILKVWTFHENFEEWLEVELYNNH